MLLAWRAAKRAEILARRPGLKDKEKDLAKLVKELELNPRQCPFSNKTDWTLRDVYEEDHALLELTFRARMKQAGKEKTVTLVLQPGDNVARKFKDAFGNAEGILSPEWTHRHYVQDDEYIPHGEDIEAFLKREIAKSIIR